jgi:hypothetical protein
LGIASRARAEAVDCRPTPLVRRLVSIAVAVVAFTAISCGASIQAVYEGDVRFEHCMALDSQPEIKPTIRRSCWEEWEKFYTFGQTRDRVDYAEVRRKQLSIVSDFDEGDWASNSNAKAKAAPDPTSAAAPPPMMLASDAGTSSNDGGKASPTTDIDAKQATSNECASSCEDSRKLCADQCKAPACDKSCASGYKRCLKHCF